MDEIELSSRHSHLSKSEQRTLHIHPLPSYSSIRNPPHSKRNSSPNPSQFLNLNITLTPSQVNHSIPISHRTYNNNLYQNNIDQSIAYVIPYKYRENPSYRVCGVKDSTDFDEEVNNILTFWYQMGIIFDLNLTVLQNQVKGQNNAAIVDLDPTLDVSDYVAYDKDKSLADENIDEEFDFNAFMNEGTIDVNIKK